MWPTTCSNRSAATCRRLLEHYSHIRIDAKRQALDALDAARRGKAGNGNEVNGNGKAANAADIAANVEVAEDLISQSRHSLLLPGFPPSGKLLIPLARRSACGPCRSVSSRWGWGPSANGEMSEWLKEHAWKAILARLTEQYRSALSHIRCSESAP